MPFNRLFLLSLCLLCILAGCSNDRFEEGVVATVDGEPIYLADVESRYDLDKLSWAAVYVPSVESLRSEYGNALSELIVHRLIDATLREANLQVTDAELAAAEAVVRADYPEGQFEAFMVEEYIDLEVWRELLRQQLAMDKLKESVLRPRVKLTYQEAEAYYREHLSDFYLPARMHFLLITGQGREQVLKARELYAQNKDIESVRNAFDAITVRELKMPLARLPVAWATLLESLSEGESSDVAVGGKGYEVLIHLGKLQAKVLEPTRAYPLVEKVLIEQKLETAFAEWLEASVAGSDIRISKLLREKAQDDIAPAEIVDVPNSDDTNDMAHDVGEEVYEAADTAEK